MSLHNSISQAEEEEDDIEILDKSDGGTIYRKTGSVKVMDEKTSDQLLTDAKTVISDPNRLLNENEKFKRTNSMNRQMSFTVKEEMDTLSNSITEIQYLDGKLFESKVAYQKEIAAIRKQIAKMFRAHQNDIEKARPYYLAKDVELQMAVELQQAANETEQAQFYFEDAKENEKAAETMLHEAKNKQENYDEVLENWNIATEKVLIASKKRADAENTLRRKEEQFLSAQRSADSIYSEVKTSAIKSWSYYSFKESCAKKLEELRKQIQKYNNKLEEAKKSYKEIFDQINLNQMEMPEKSYMEHFPSEDQPRYEELPDIDYVISCFETIHNRMNSGSRNSTFDEEDGDMDLQASTPLCKENSLDKSLTDENESLDNEVFNSSNEEAASDKKPIPFLD